LIQTAQDTATGTQQAFAAALIRRRNRMGFSVTRNGNSLFTFRSQLGHVKIKSWPQAQMVIWLNHEEHAITIGMVTDLLALFNREFNTGAAPLLLRH
jgi:hypothetical protein